VKEEEEEEEEEVVVVVEEVKVAEAAFLSQLRIE
jgi:hypothetical protein